MPIALLALTLSAFAIGTTEFVIVGLLPTIAADLGVDLPSAGLLVSLYALGVAVGAPLLTALTGKLPRKALLLGLMLLFSAGNLLAWQAPGGASASVINVPLADVPQQASAWLGNTARPLVFFCRSGRRSLRALQCLASQGHNQVWHLAGGLAMHPALSTGED